MLRALRHLQEVRAGVAIGAGEAEVGVEVLARVAAPPRLPVELLGPRERQMGFPAAKARVVRAPTLSLQATPRSLTARASKVAVPVMAGRATVGREDLGETASPDLADGIQGIKGVPDPLETLDPVEILNQ